MINFFNEGYWDEYIEQIEDSAYWKISVGAMLADMYGDEYILELEDVAEIPVNERQSALREIIWKYRRD